MVQVSDQEFDRLVAQGIDAIPARFRELMQNVAVVVVDEPTEGERRELKLRRNEDLYGLYQGIPQINRRLDSGVLPDKITIFKGPIERAANSPEHVCAIVRDTVWHEVAHHFGFSETAVRRAESRRTRGSG